MQSMEGRLVVQRADERCLLDILDIWQDAAQWLRAQQIDQWMPTSFDLSEVQACLTGGNELFLLKEDGAAAGTFYINWSDPFIWGDSSVLDEEPAGYIHRLAVGRSRHGRGLGKLMLDWAEQYISSQGKSIMRLDCMADNPQLNAYYRAAGFQYVRRLDTREWSTNLYEKKAIPYIASIQEISFRL